MGEGTGPRARPWCTSPRSRLARPGPLRAVGHSLSQAAASAGIHIATPSDGAVPVSECVICEDRLVIRLTGLEYGVTACSGQSVQSQAVLFVQG